MINYFTFVIRELIFSIFNSKKGNSILKGLNIVDCFSVDYKSNKIKFFRHLSELEDEDIKGTPKNIDGFYNEYIYPEDEKEIRRQFFLQARNKDFKYIEFKIKTVSGYKWVKVVGRFIFNRKGEVIKLRAVLKDITDLKEKELKLKIDIKEREEKEKKLNRLVILRESVLEISHSIMETNDINELFNIILDRALKSIRDGQIGAVLVLDEENNLGIKAYRGYRKSEMDNFKIPLKKSFLYETTNGEIEKTIIINNIEEMVDIVHKSALYNEGDLYIRSSISAPIFVDDKLYGFLNVDSENKHAFDQSDIELMEYWRLQISMAIEKHQLYEKTIEFSRYDELTGVFNRRYFEVRLNAQLEKSKRYDEKFCLVVYDLNKFKEVNDNYGHLVGDFVLKDFADRLKNNFKSSDIVGRLGGDEFVSLIYNEDKDSVAGEIEKIRKRLNEESLIFEGISLNYDFSYGISSFRDDATDFNSLLKDADKKMYKNKNENRKKTESFLNI